MIERRDAAGKEGGGIGQCKMPQYASGSSIGVPLDTPFLTFAGVTRVCGRVL
jgi:hypothetical protein